MARPTTNLDEEKRSYAGLWLVMSLLLFVCSIWAVVDDNFFRRPWKYYQAMFNRMEIDRTKTAISTEQERLNADADYQAAVKALADAQQSIATGDAAKEIAKIEHELAEARLDDQGKDLNFRFIKSELEELRFNYDDAEHQGNKEKAEAILKVIEEKNAIRDERSQIFKESQAKIAGMEGRIKEIRGQVKAAEDNLAKLTAARDDLQLKLETISLGYYPGPLDHAPYFGTDWQPKIPKIQQLVLNEYDRNNFDQPVARVDRCTSCHTGINKAGFEDQPNPWKTHPKRELYLTKHENLGCTSCHQGQGPAVNSPDKAHGSWIVKHGDREIVETDEYNPTPMFRGEKMQANCIKCHQSLEGLEGAEIAAKGEKLFVEIGCVGCHIANGYEDSSKMNGVSAVGPSLRRIGAKLDPAFMVRWITNPQAVRPRTRMPNFYFTEEQATQITAYLLSVSKDPSEKWLGEHAAVDIAPGGELAAKGKEVVDSVGCRACHALAPDEVASQLGANKDVAPNLSNISEKTNARWIFNWVRNPRGFSEVARMPNLRLSDDEARAVTAYLETLGTKKEAPAALDAALADAANVAAGEKLVRKYGCAGCHDIPGMETESRVGAELSSFGGKTKEELFFGDRVDMPETWDDWTYEKIHTPRGYATKWIEQAMPHFNLADEDIKAIRVFLTSRTDAKVNAKYQYKSAWQPAIVNGRRLVGRYNCTGCHVIEGHGGDVRRLYEENPSLAPPNLNTEGRKVQQPWLFSFLKAPSPIRPWLKIRMPTFGLSDTEAKDIIAYFGALEKVDQPFVYLQRANFSPSNVEAGKALASKDVFNCFSCHVRGSVNPEGSPSDWAPDLSMAHLRLNPEWIIDWLHDPQKIFPGTKMPSFYPDPNAPDGPPDILGGDDEAQMKALRDYVITLGLPGGQGAPSPAQAANVVSNGPGASQ